MRWALDGIAWTLNWLMLAVLSSVLLLLRACNHELRQPFAVTLNKRDFTVVFWRDSRAILLPHQVRVHTSTGLRSTWLSLLCQPWQMSDTRGNPGVEVGTVPTPFTLNSQDPHSGPHSNNH